MGWFPNRLRPRRIVRRLWPPRKLVRAQYREVWNAQAVSESAAKHVVSGFTDEAKYRHTAEITCATLRECVGIRPEDVVLEIGAGVGRVGWALAPLCKQWIGADVSENMLRHLRRRLEHLPNVRTVVLNGYNLDGIASESVDLVYCTVVFMHLDEWERFSYIREGMRVLKPGGRMLVDNFSLLTDQGWNLFLDLANVPPLDRPPYSSRASTPQELLTYFQRAGFQDVRFKEDDLWITVFGSKAA